MIASYDNVRAAVDKVNLVACTCPDKGPVKFHTVAVRSTSKYPLHKRSESVL